MKNHLMHRCGLMRMILQSRCRLDKLDNGSDAWDVDCRSKVIFTPNHIYVPVAYLGILGAGAAFSGLNPAYTVTGMAEAAFQMTVVGAKLVLVHPDLLGKAWEAAKKAGVSKDQLFLFSDQESAPIDGVRDWRSMIAPPSEGDSWTWLSLSPEESLTQVATHDTLDGGLFLFPLPSVEER